MASDNAQQILDELKPMFVKAREEGLWFYCNYQDLWFSPNELSRLHADGRFIWGAVNWTLRDPSECLRYMEKQIDDKHAEIARFKERMEDAPCHVCNGTGEVVVAGDGIVTTALCGACQVRCLNCYGLRVSSGRCADCDWPAGKVPPPWPLCSICRRRHPSDDRHPCE